MVPDDDSSSTSSSSFSSGDGGKDRSKVKDFVDSDPEETPPRDHRTKLSQLISEIKEAESRLKGRRDSRTHKFTIRLSSLINMMGVSQHSMLTFTRWRVKAFWKTHQLT